MIDSIVSFSEEKVIDKELISGFVSNLYYYSMDNSLESDYTALKSFLKEIDDKNSVKGNYIFYTATPPSMYEVIAVNLARAGLCRQDEWFQKSDHRKALWL